MKLYQIAFFSIILGIITFGSSQGFAELKDVNIPSGTGVPGCEIENRCYIPSLLEVKTGDQVKWKNNDATIHTVTSGSALSGPDTKFDSGLVNTGSEFSFIFEKPGSYPYYCVVHPWMEGLVIATVAKDMKPVKSDPNLLTQTMVSSKGTIFVTVETTKPKAASMQVIEVRFTDKNQNLLIHMNYDISVIQGSYEIFGAKNQHSSDGTVEHTIKAETDKPIDVNIALRGIYPEGEKPRPVMETITFQKIPEFGILTVIVLGTSLAATIMVRSKMGTKI